MRKVDTLRVSVTDRCNLRCIYCMPPQGVELIPHREILSFEEIERVVRSAVKAGVQKVRLTGGEPLVRRGFSELVKRLSRVEGIRDLPMTTNGVLLQQAAGELKAAGLTRVTVSMDTLKRDRYKRIARRDELPRVMEGVEEAISVGLAPVKINVVVVVGVNDDEAVDFAGLAGEKDLEVRFIERMPITAGPHCGLSGEGYVPSARLKAVIEKETGRLEPAAEGRGPARVFRLPGGRGRIGFIAPLSEPFCKWCQRMRLTPDGRLRPCLAEESEIDLKGPLRSGATDADIKKLFETAVATKPAKDSACFGEAGRMMSQIGG